MFGFLKTKWTKKARASVKIPAPVAPRRSQAHNNIHHELIRVVLKDTLRLHGIPLGWLACEVITIARSAGKNELHIQLMVMKWNEKLLRYACALQQQLLLGLDRFDPSVDHSKYIVSWRFSPTCSIPFKQMPDPEFWLSGHEPPVAKEAPIPILDRRRAPRPSKAHLLETSFFDACDRSSNFPATDVIPLR